MNFDLLNAVSHLERLDGIVAIPGLNCYWLASRPGHVQALARIRRVTGQQEPFMLLGREKEAFGPYLESLPPVGEALMRRYWPGALVILLPAQASVSERITAGRGQVQLMQPESPLLLALLSLVPEGVLAVSNANRSAAATAVTAHDVYNAFGEDVDFVLPGDDWIRESLSPTVVSVEGDGKLHLLRSGAIVLD
jgi:L-threonylcarbamoyladenylate synthase